MLFIITFILGTIIGSFLNVLVDRTDTEKSPFRGRSFCPYCGKTLAWWEMVPVLNYFYLRGRCSSCHHKLPLQYPFIEFLTGFLFALASWRFLRFPLINFHSFLVGNLESVLLWLNFLFWLYWIFVLIAISLYDLKKYLILNEVLLPALILTFSWKVVLGLVLLRHDLPVVSQTLHLLGAQSYVFGNYSYFVSLILGAVVSGGLISLIAYLTKEKAMGWGDALVAFFLGLILGWPEALMALMIAFLVGGVVAVILIIFNKKTLKSYLPFAPFLAFGALSILLFGDIIIGKYLELFLL
ncbi:MAG: prepilin peptidase [Candidatus Atribacteria bacterium]|nr:prepilin peptidase [Candidatus Atribacteria bacterium]